jgi:hypothetical protein
MASVAGRTLQFFGANDYIFFRLFADKTEDNSLTLQIKGLYAHDKNLYKQTVHDFLDAHIPPISGDKLSCVESFIAETALMCRPQVVKPVHFSLVMPTPVQVSDSATTSSLGIRIINFLFDMQDGGKKVAVSRSLHECGIDLELFHQQKLDPKDMAAGRTIVNRSTIDLIL